MKEQPQSDGVLHLQQRHLQEVLSLGDTISVNEAVGREVDKVFQKPTRATEPATLLRTYGFQVSQLCGAAALSSV